MSRLRVHGALLALALVASGCATTSGGAPRPVTGPGADPWENWNRKVYAFNDAIDRAVLKPVATAYVDYVPQPVRTGVSNFFGNFGDAWSAINNFLQGKIANGFQDVMRVGTNTVFGIGGLFDVATEAGIEKQGEDLGQTFGRWGFGPGPYVVWPLLGPSTLRDSFALPADRYVSPLLLTDHDSTRGGIVVLGAVDQRAALLGASRVLDDVALDKYAFTRDGYLQRRRSLVYDGNPPPLPSDGSDGGSLYDIDEGDDSAAPAAAAASGAEPASSPGVPAATAPASAPQ
jgi:phospholipid-binding lipoprotein MlaA